MDAGASVGNTERVKMKSSKEEFFIDFLGNDLGQDSGRSLHLLKKTVRVRTSHFQQSATDPHSRTKSRKNCRKARYRDLAEAIEVLHRIDRYRMYAEERGQVLTHRLECRAYFCPKCQGAHLTSLSDESLRGEKHAA